MSSSAIDSFPDELLLQMFCHLPHWRDKLLGVRGVCRRWRALAVDPSCWRGGEPVGFRVAVLLAESLPRVDHIREETPAGTNSAETSSSAAPTALNCALHVVAPLTRRTTGQAPRLAPGRLVDALTLLRRHVTALTIVLDDEEDHVHEWMYMIVDGLSHGEVACLTLTIPASVFLHPLLKQILRDYPRLRAFHLRATQLIGKDETALCTQTLLGAPHLEALTCVVGPGRGYFDPVPPWRPDHVPAAGNAMRSVRAGAVRVEGDPCGFFHRARFPLLEHLYMVYQSDRNPETALFGRDPVNVPANLQTLALRVPRTDVQLRLAYPRLRRLELCIVAGETNQWALVEPHQIPALQELVVYGSKSGALLGVWLFDLFGQLPAFNTLILHGLDLSHDSCEHVPLLAALCNAWWRKPADEYEETVAVCGEHVLSMAAVTAVAAEGRSERVVSGAGASEAGAAAVLEGDRVALEASINVRQATTDRVSTPNRPETTYVASAEDALGMRYMEVVITRRVA